jgi:ABC-type polysaccharide/polyol phosphate export permease
VANRKLQINSLPCSLLGQWARMVSDVTATASAWRLWLLLGWNDVATQYRRSFLGPVWITISTGIFVLAFGMLGAQLFGMRTEEFLPYFAVGYVLFVFLSTLITDGCETFSAAETYLKHGSFPKLIFPLRVLIRNIVLLAHNVVIIVFVLISFDKFAGIQWAAFFVGLLLTFLVATFVIVILGCLSARFRDIPMMVRSIMQIMFFMTPVFWTPDNLTARGELIVVWNPLALFLDLLRSPLLGSVPPLMQWLKGAGWLAGTAIIATLVFLYCRRRLVYWV